MNYDVILWAAALVFAIIAEVGTAALVSVWFMPGIVVSLVLAVCEVDVWIQVVAFVALSAVCLFLGFKFFRKRMFKNPKTAMNADGLIGELAVVTEEIDNLLGTGSVKIQHQTWSARSATEEKIALGSVVRVEEISGVKLICKPYKTEEKQ